jgi:rhamnose transport system ATP-binding protein
VERTAAFGAARQMEVRANNIWQKARELSGGNQQKIVLAKWLATKPRIMILDEPTRGIDVGTKAAVHALMSKLASEGMAILMISSELPEVLGMSDRVIVMREGHLTGHFTRAEATQEKIISAATQAVATGSAI